jgi:hypothetical protein
LKGLNQGARYRISKEVQDDRAGEDMLLKDHNIILSTRTINRILNAHNLIQKRRKKPHRNI